MLYMPERTKMFEVRDLYDDLKNSVYALASALNIDYFYMERSQPLSTGGKIDVDILEINLSKCINSIN